MQLTVFAFNKCVSFVDALADGSLNPKLLLTQTEPSVSMVSIDQVAEIAPSGAYPAGGLPVVFEAGGGHLAMCMAMATVLGPIEQFQYLVLYNANTGALCGWWSLGGQMSVAAGEHLTLIF